jgi:nitrite reductase (NADH) small subunit
MMRGRTSDGGRIHICATSEIPPGADRIVEVHGVEIGIYNIDGEYVAVRNWCPHRGAPVCRGVRTGTMVPSPTLGTYEWGMEGRVLRCPWHRWEFDLVTGRTLFGIDKRRLIQYRVSVEDGQVYLHPRPAEVRRLEAEGTMPVATEMEGDDGSDR